MMMSLSDIFDPVSFGGFHLHWISFFVFFFMFNISYWSINCFLVLFLGSILKFLSKFIFDFLSFGDSVYLFSLYFFILWSNIIGLVSYVYIFFAQIGIVWGIVSIMFINLFFVSMLKSLYYSLSRCLFSEIPYGMMFFLGVVEGVGSFIRPFVVTCRISSNLIVSHILCSSIMSGNIDLKTFMYLYPFLLFMNFVDFTMYAVQGYVVVMFMGLMIGKN